MKPCTFGKSNISYFNLSYIYTPTFHSTKQNKSVFMCIEKEEKEGPPTMKTNQQEGGGYERLSMG